MMPDIITAEERALIDTAIKRRRVTKCPPRTFALDESNPPSRPWGWPGKKQTVVKSKLTPNMKQMRIRAARLADIERLVAAGITDRDDIERRFYVSRTTMTNDLRELAADGRIPAHVAPPRMRG